MKRITVIIFFVALLLSVGANGQNGEALSYFVRAQGDFLLNQIDSANYYLDKSLQLDKNNDAAWFLKFKIESLSSPSMIPTPKAIEYLDKAHQLDPNNSQYTITKVLYLINTSHHDEAIAKLETLVNQKPKEEEAYGLLLREYGAYIHAGRHEYFDKYNNLSDKYLENFGETAEYFYNKYIGNILKGDREKTIDDLINADAKFPMNAWKELLAEQYLAINQDSLAEKYYDLMLVAEPNNQAAQFGKMEIARTNNKHEEFFDYLDRYFSNNFINNSLKINYLNDLFRSGGLASYLSNEPKAKRLEESFNLFAEQFPTDSAVVLFVTSYNLYRKNDAQAEKLMDNLIAVYPDDLTVMRYYSNVLYNSKQWDKIKDFADKRLAKVPDPQSERFLLEVKLSADYASKDYKGGIKTAHLLEKLSKSEKDNDKLLDAYSILGDLYHSVNDSKSCFKYYKKALDIDPEYCPVLNNYAWYLATDGSSKNLNKAQQMSKITIQKEVGNSTYLDTYAYILFKQGKAEEAKKYYQQAIGYNTDLSAVILKHYAQCLYYLGEYDLSATYYLKAYEKAKEEEESDEINLIMNEVRERSANLKIQLK